MVGVPHECYPHRLGGGYYTRQMTGEELGPQTEGALRIKANNAGCLKKHIDRVCKVSKSIHAASKTKTRGDAIYTTPHFLTQSWVIRSYRGPQ